MEIPSAVAGGGGKVLHIAMFPWLAFGHFLPFLQLSKIMARKGHKISFISTPSNIDRLPRLPPTLASLITFVKIPLPPVDGLPASAEATSDLQETHEVIYLIRAYDLLQQPLAEFLSKSRPDWVIFDYSPFWLPAIARDLGIPTAFFSIFLAAAVAFTSPPADQEEDYRITVEEVMVKPKWVPFESSLAYRYFEAKKIFPMVLGDDLQPPEFYRFQQALKGCDLIAVKSCPEFESHWLNLLEEIHRKPVIPVGVLPATIDEKEGDNLQSWRWIEEWLDEKKRGSVVYVAFGSEAQLSEEELTEMACGLEMSGLPFIWMLRSRRGPELPEGFEERTKGRGVVLKEWAPQVVILSHDSVGGFLTHCGSGSLVEGLQFGRPLLMLTFYSDQGLNAKMLREKGVGYLVPRDEVDGRFTRDSVAESVRTVVVGEEGASYRVKAMEMKGLFGDMRKHDNYVHAFLDQLTTWRR